MKEEIMDRETQLYYTVSAVMETILRPLQMVIAIITLPLLITEKGIKLRSKLIDQINVIFNDY